MPSPLRDINWNNPAGLRKGKGHRALSRLAKNVNQQPIKKSSKDNKKELKVKTKLIASKSLVNSNKSIEKSSSEPSTSNTFSTPLNTDGIEIRKQLPNNDHTDGIGLIDFCLNMDISELDKILNTMENKDNEPQPPLGNKSSNNSNSSFDDQTNENTQDILMQFLNDSLVGPMETPIENLQSETNTESKFKDRVYKSKNLIQNPNTNKTEQSTRSKLICVQLRRQCGLRQLSQSHNIKCPLCDQKFYLKSRMVKHLKEHKMQTYVCCEHNWAEMSSNVSCYFC